MWLLRKLSPSGAFMAEVGRYGAFVATSSDKIHELTKNGMPSI